MKVGVVSVIGKPNVGKSTLINTLVGTKLSGVSPKPQTTRQKIIAIYNSPSAQVVFLDTPGVLERKINELQREMDRETWSTLDEGDLVLMVTDPTPPDERDILIVERLREVQKPKILAINKIDRVKKAELLPVMDAFAKLLDFEEIIPISALKVDGLDILMGEILKRLPEGEPLFPQDQASTLPLRFFVAEIIREKIFLRYRKEVPYSTAVEVEEFREDENLVYISATIYVERESQKGILIGKGGRALKEVGRLAREELEYLLGKKVYLELWVKVKPGWRRDIGFIRRLRLG